MILGEEYNNPYKKYVDIMAVFYADGQMKPITIIWEDGRKFEIDRILDIRRAASLKAGGSGIRYICMVSGKQVTLFLEENRWFIEINK